jgi:hypothetical protein
MHEKSIRAKDMDHLILKPNREMNSAGLIGCAGNRTGI